MSKQTSNKLSPEVRSRAVRLVLDHELKHPLLVERTFAWISRNRRLRALRNERYCILPPRHDPHHAQATCCKCLTIETSRMGS
jgi:hypothetical protein